MLNDKVLSLTCWILPDPSTFSSSQAVTRYCEHLFDLIDLARYYAYLYTSLTCQLVRESLARETDVLMSETTSHIIRKCSHQKSIVFTFSTHICCTHWLLCRSMNQCPLCEDFSTPTFQLLIQHIGQVHSKSSDFHLTCGVDNCQTTYTNFAAFKRHLRKKHQSCIHETFLTSEIQTCGSFQEEDEDPSVDEGYL